MKAAGETKDIAESQCVLRDSWESGGYAETEMGRRLQVQG
jgi:hypothetical protein